MIDEYIYIGLYLYARSECGTPKLQELTVLHRAHRDGKTLRFESLRELRKTRLHGQTCWSELSVMCKRFDAFVDLFH